MEPFTWNGGESPVVRVYREAMTRWQHEVPPTPEAHQQQSRTLLAHLAPEQADKAVVGFAYGAAGLLAAHTHYFNGFALLLSVPQGIAVAACPATGPESRLLFHKDQTLWILAADQPIPPDWPLSVVLTFSLLRQLTPQAQALNVTVYSSVPTFSQELYLSTLAIALTRCLQAWQTKIDVHPRHLAQIVASCIGAPFSVAYLLAAASAQPGTFLLIDTETLELLPLKGPDPEVLRWLMVDAGCTLLPPPAFHLRQQELAQRVVEILRRRGFRELTSLRELAHRDLPRAQALLPQRFHPVVRYLVSENQRVQRMVFAIRNQDWQMLGTLLLMSHAALRHDWQASCAEADLIVSVAESMSLEGIFGASMNGYGHGVLVAGRPFQLPLYLERMQQSCEIHFGRHPATLLL
jgi:galactokinase